jgi:hypothetical protein
MENKHLDPQLAGAMAKMIADTKYNTIWDERDKCSFAINLQQS